MRTGASGCLKDLPPISRPLQIGPQENPGQHPQENRKQYAEKEKIEQLRCDPPLLSHTQQNKLLLPIPKWRITNHQNKQQQHDGKIPVCIW
jgi:hypothetical protein